jgi:molybdenum cofactor synthesis domain-containing protein
MADASAAILTIGNEIVSGDVENTNASWLAKRLAPLGVGVRLIAAIPDDVAQIVAFIRAEAPLVDYLLVTGGLGGTPDDLTRQALAAAFDVPQVMFPEVRERLHARFTRNPDYVTPWAMLPRGARPLLNPLGGAPGFQIENVYVMPGLPREMEAMFAEIEEDFRRPSPIGAWRRRYRTSESRIVGVLQATVDRYPAVLVGSYPSFDDSGPEVEVVLKSSDAAALATAVAWIEPELAEAARPEPA